MSSRMEITEAKGRWDEIVSRARSGEEIVLSERGQPVVRITSAGSAQNGTRVFGEFAGEVRVSDDFAAPLTGKDLAEWEK